DVALKLRRIAISLDISPERELLVLPEAARVAGAEIGEHLRGEPGDIALADLHPREERFDRVDDLEEIAHALGPSPGQDTGAPAHLGDRHFIAAYQVLCHVAAALSGDALHRIDDVPVERGEEAEPVLSRQVGAPAHAGVLLGLAPRLPTEATARLVDVDLEVIGELVGRAEPTDPA